jgi:hypothetical protein
MKKLNVLLVSNRKSCVQSFTSHFKGGQFGDFVLMFAENLAGLEKEMERFHFDIFIVDHFGLPNESKKIWNAIRGTDLQAYTLPIIWVGQKLRDAKFVIETDLGKTICIAADNDGSFSAEDVSVASKNLDHYFGTASGKDYKKTNLKPQEVLFKEDDIGDAVYILISGVLEVFKMKDGEPVKIGRVEPGDFVGEQSYLNKSLRSATVVATDTCELLRIPFLQFETEINTKLSWSNKLLQLYAKRLVEANRKQAS